jgi:hypothetical protein
MGHDTGSAQEKINCTKHEFLSLSVADNRVSRGLIA